MTGDRWMTVDRPLTGGPVTGAPLTGDVRAGDRRSATGGPLIGGPVTGDGRMTGPVSPGNLTGAVTGPGLMQLGSRS